MNTTTDVPHCRRGHPLTDDNTYIEANGRGHGHTRCRTCRRNANRSYRHHRMANSTLLPKNTPRPSAPALSWRLHARCRGADPEDFLAEDTERGIPERAREAAAHYCATCPVLDECGATATAFRDHGLWGGAWRDHDRHSNCYRLRDLI